jgi:hypothetical protein
MSASADVLRDWSAGSGATGRAGSGRRALDRSGPGNCRFGGIGRAPDIQVGDDAQAGVVLDRLVRRAILAEADGIMGVTMIWRCFISAAMRIALRA